MRGLPDALLEKSWFPQGLLEDLEKQALSQDGPVAIQQLSGAFQAQNEEQEDPVVYPGLWQEGLQGSLGAPGVQVYFETLWNHHEAVQYHPGALWAQDCGGAWWGGGELLEDWPEVGTDSGGSLWQEAAVMQDCRDTQRAPVDVCVPQIQGCDGLLLALHHSGEDLPVLAQPEMLQGCCQVPLGLDGGVLEKVWGTGVQGDAVKD